ncbi:hypothetical protein ABZ387_28095 [Streptomyces flaveolus]|uniref:hypothetical protein n=1 Tax=Streptomyces flaveolus TaxID=67297 RepID=UPI0033C5C4BD
MKNWQKDAQPEWPGATSGARDVAGQDPQQDATQVLPAAGAFPGTGTAAAPAPGAVPGGPGAPAGAGWFGGAREFPHGTDVPRPDTGAAETEVLRPRAGADLFGGTTRQDRTGQDRIGQDRIGQGRAPRHGGHRRGDAPRPDTDRTDVLPSAAQAAPTRAFPAPGPATAALRDPWQETPDALDADAPDATDPRPATGADHTHDPHEVTVQLDAVQLGDGMIRRAAANRPGKHAASDASDGPVFVDESGRRSRRFRRIGIALGGACAIYAVVIVSTLLSGNSNAPWLPVPGQEQGKPAGQVDTTPLPSQSAQPSVSGSAAPQTSPTAGTGAATTPGADAPVPGASGTARQPGTSTDPRPSTSATAPKPGGGGAAEPDPTVSTQQPPPATTDPSTPAGGGETTVEPTAPTDGGTATTDPGGGTTVNGASDTSPVAAGTAAAPAVDTAPADTSTSPSLSPEYTL